MKEYCNKEKKNIFFFAVSSSNSWRWKEASYTVRKRGTICAAK